MKKKLLTTLLTITIGSLLIFSSCSDGANSAAGAGGPDESPEATLDEDPLKEPATGSEVEVLTSADQTSVTDENKQLLVEEIVVAEIETILEEENFGNDSAVSATDGSSSTDNTVASDSSSGNEGTETAASDTLSDTDETGAVAEDDSTDTGAVENDDSDETVASNETEAPTEDVTSEEDADEADIDATVDEPLDENEIDALLAEDDSDLDAIEGPDSSPAHEEAVASLLDTSITVTPANGSRWLQVPQKELKNDKSDENSKLEIKLEKLVKRAEKITAKLDRISNASNRAKKLQRLARINNSIKKIREKIGYTTGQLGIYTAWANQELTVNIQDIHEAGYYSLSILAKNIYGNLPTGYEFFNLAVYDQNGNEVAGLFVPATTDTYQKGTALVYLESGATTLTLKWTNDAYKKGEYDANIQVKSILLSKTSASDRKALRRYTTKNIRTAFQYSEIMGRFFWSKDGAYTSWANQTLAFTYKDLEPGKYKVVVWAKNRSSLPLAENYKQFDIEVEASSGESADLKVKANSNKFKAGRTNINLAGGDTTIYITWTNDSYKQGEYDANIEIKQIKLKRIGNYEGSALTAYLLGTDAGNRLLLITILTLLIGVIAAISIYNKRQSERAKL